MTLLYACMLYVYTNNALKMRKIIEIRCENICNIVVILRGKSLNRNLDRKQIRSEK